MPKPAILPNQKEDESASDLIAAYLPGDEAGGIVTLYDETENGIDGALTGSMDSNDWVLNGGIYSLDYEGADDYVNFPNSGVIWDSTHAMSVSWWGNYTGVYGGASTFPGVISFKTDQATGFVIAYGAQASYAGVFFGSNANFLRFKTSTDFSAQLQNAWNHVVLTFDGIDRTASSSYKIYVNGRDEAIDAAGAFGTQANALYIGRNSGGSNFFKGMIARILIYGRELSPNDANDLYNIGLEGEFLARPSPGIALPSFSAFDAVRQAIINGLDGDLVGAGKWDDEVRDGTLKPEHVTRFSDTEVRIALPATAAYDIATQETVTCTVPSAALVTSDSDVIGIPTFTIDVVSGTNPKGPLSNPFAGPFAGAM